MSVFAAVREGEAGRVTEAGGRSMQDLGHLSQREHRARPDAGYPEKIGEIDGRSFARSRERSGDAPADDVLPSDVMMLGHRQVGKWEGSRLRRSDLVERAQNDFGACMDELHLGGARSRRASIGEVDDRALRLAVDRGMGFVDEARESFAQPVIAAGGSIHRSHSLLNNGPSAVGGHDESVQVQVEPVLNGGAVHFGHQAAGPRKRRPVDPCRVSDPRQLGGRLARVTSAPPTYVDAELERNG